MTACEQMIGPINLLTVARRNTALTLFRVAVIWRVGSGFEVQRQYLLMTPLLLRHSGERHGRDSRLTLPHELVMCEVFQPPGEDMLLECPEPLGSSCVLQASGIQAELALGLHGIPFTKTVGLVRFPYQTVFQVLARTTMSPYSRKKAS